mmetsp:Transcript_30504/g.71980  ORF Transcript_30504/g.71980 Transcript_30504/m.71980 type:complete len:245 (-) Transcript_30504:175-909(-)
MTGKSSLRGTWATPKECHTTTSSPSRFRLASVHLGSPSLPSPWTVKSPDGYRSSSLCWVTHRCLVAKAPFCETADDGAVSRVGWDGPKAKGMSLYAVGLPLKGLMLLLLLLFAAAALEIFQHRAVSELQLRWALCSSLRMRSSTRKAFPYGLVISSTGSDTRSTSETVLEEWESTAMSRRAQNMCWWIWALTPGATMVPWVGVFALAFACAFPCSCSSLESRLVDSSPDSLILKSMQPSCLKCQ